MESIKARNEEKRKRKEARMRRCADEMRQKKMGANAGHSVISSPLGPPLPKYVSRPRDASVVQRPEYVAAQVGLGRREVAQAMQVTQVAQVAEAPFMDDEDEEVSVAFSELMTEIAKYEGTGAK